MEETKKEDNKIISAAWIYGAFFGLMPAYVFCLITVATYPDFRFVYYIRLVFAIIIGALVGGYSAAFSAKIAINKLRNSGLVIRLLSGLVLGSICGFVTLGSTPLMLLIESTDINKAWEMIYRLSMIGLTLGGTAGIFFGGMLDRYLKLEN